MENTEARSSNFTIVPNDNQALYRKNSAFNILHVYIVERVRSFDKQNKTCYIKNEQLAEATGSSEKTISRAIKLLVDEKVLWAGYHYQTEDCQVTKQRVLRIFNDKLEEYHSKKTSATTKEMDKMSTSKNDDKESNLGQGQNVQESETNCPPQIDKMTGSDGQNDPLVYKENIKEDNYKKGEELDSSLVDSHNAHPESNYEPFGGVYTEITKNRRRSLEEIEASLYDIEDDEI
jgi:hypothetical protein